MIKALRLSWVNRLLSNSKETWKAVPNFNFEKFGGLPFLMNCNFETSKLPQTILTFYSKLLDFFNELRSNFEHPTGREFSFFRRIQIQISVKSNFLEYYQVVSVIPKYLKDKAFQSSIPKCSTPC